MKHYETKKVEHCHELWLSIIIQFSIVSRGNAHNKDLYDLYVLPPMILTNLIVGHLAIGFY